MGLCKFVHNFSKQKVCQNNPSSLLVDWGYRGGGAQRANFLTSSQAGQIHIKILFIRIFIRIKSYIKSKVKV